MKIRKFNEGRHIGDEMEYLTNEEFEKRKSDIKNQLKILCKDYDEFTKMISPKHWRESGHYYAEISKISNLIDGWKKVSHKELENEWVRKNIED